MTKIISQKKHGLFGANCIYYVYMIYDVIKLCSKERRKNGFMVNSRSLSIACWYAIIF